MSKASDHHGFTDQDAASYDVLFPTAKEIRRCRWQFDSLADSESFGTLVVEAADRIDATYAAVWKLQDGSAFWKR